MKFFLIITKSNQFGVCGYKYAVSSYLMKLACSVFFILTCSMSANAQNLNTVSSGLLDPGSKTPKMIVDDFMDKRFGMFIHFGPVSLRGTEIGWSRGNEVPTLEYDNLYKEFNPQLFNADQWVKIAKDSGMKYLVITAKHHDGFCLWPTAFSDYNIMNSPFKRDIVEELSIACQKQGLAFCIYFTVADWHDPNYTQDQPGNMDRFVLTMKNELKEVISRYKPYMLWFDGNWEKQWKQEYGNELYQFIKSLDKNVIVNNRLGKGEHTSFSPESVGDYLTPEQKIGELNMVDPWESCITICNQWAWKPNDKMKTLKECIQTLVKTAGGNGNLLFNVGPMMDGRIEVRQVERLKEMGTWLTKYGRTIYGTKGGPYKPNNTYATTRKGNLIYLHIFERNQGKLILPALIGAKIKKAYLFDGEAVTFVQNKDFGVLFNLPKVLPDTISSVIVLELDKNVENLSIAND